MKEKRRRPFRIRIFQPIVPEYRVALFEGLSRKYSGRIEVWASAKMGCDKSCPLTNMPYDYGHCFYRVGPFQWQSGFSLKGLIRNDVCVVCGDIHEISSLVIAFLARLRGIRVVWWGHHVSAHARKCRVRLRLLVARLLSDVMLCYTDEGIKYLKDHGFANGKVFATGNTIDLDAVQRAKDAWDGVRKFGSKHTLIFCGVLREKVRLDVLLRALKILLEKRNDLHCIVIGSGEMEECWRALAQELGIASAVSWVGELRGQEKLAPWFLSADLFVYPGRIGLSLIHAFSYGLPVILNDNSSNHGPEYVVFRPGWNGLSFHENDDRDLSEKIEMALGMESIRRFGENGRREIFEKYSMDRMVMRFSQAIEATAE